MTLINYISDTGSEVRTFTLSQNILRIALPVSHKASVWSIYSCEPILLKLVRTVSNLLVEINWLYVKIHDLL